MSKRGSVKSNSPSNKLFIKIILVLGFLGLLTSLYLVKSHYTGIEQGSVCDFGETISCSIVNTSIYSEIFNVPVAVFGAIWFVVLLLMTWKAMKNEKLVVGLLAMSIVGLLSMIYLIGAEIILQSLCPFCTVVHVIIVITFILSLIMYKRQNKIPKKEVINILRPWIGLMLLINFILFLGFNLLSASKEDLTPLAQCLTEKGVNMYGSFRCGVCAQTRSMFGDAFEYVKEIECHPDGKNSQWQLCLDKSIKGTPTWVLEPNGVEQKRYKGFLNADELREFSGCQV